METELEKEAEVRKYFKDKTMEHNARAHAARIDSFLNGHRQFKKTIFGGYHVEVMNHDQDGLVHEKWHKKKSREVYLYLSHPKIQRLGYIGSWKQDE